MKNAKFENREAYLTAAIAAFKKLFTDNGAKYPPVRVSTGWPSSRGTSSKRRALGECWDASAAADEVPQIFISPFMDNLLDVDKGDACGVLPTLVHELCHSSLGIKAGHGPAFRRLALAVGLEGKMTSTHAGEKLLALCKEVAAKLGEYPHAKLDFSKSGKKKQGTRMIKCECEECGYSVRTTQKWLELGAPICPVKGHGPMKFELPDGTNEDEDNE